MKKVVYTADARDQALALPRLIGLRITKLIERLEQWPEISGVKALSGNLAGKYRLRTGDYRLQFRVEGETVIVEKVGHRDGFYDA